MKYLNLAFKKGTHYMLFDGSFNKLINLKSVDLIIYNQIIFLHKIRIKNLQSNSLQVLIKF